MHWWPFTPTTLNPSKTSDPQSMPTQRDWKPRASANIWHQKHAMNGVNETHERKRSNTFGGDRETQALKTLLSSEGPKWDRKEELKIIINMGDYVKPNLSKLQCFQFLSISYKLVQRREKDSHAMPPCFACSFPRDVVVLQQIQFNSMGGLFGGRGSSGKTSTQPNKLWHLFPFSLFMFMWLNMIGSSLTIECVGM